MPFDLTGLPAVSIPGGFAAEDAPVGFQIAGRAFDEALVLRAARAYERATSFHERHPGI
jgi:amidase